MTRRARRSRLRVRARLAAENPPWASTPHSPSSMPNNDSTTRCGRSCTTCTATCRAEPSGMLIQIRSSAEVSPLTRLISATPSVWHRQAARSRRLRRAAGADGRSRESRVHTSLHFQSIAHLGACGKTRVMPQNRRPGPEPAENGSREVRVLLSAYGSRGDVEPMAGLAVRLRALGAQVRACAPPGKEFAERLADVGDRRARTQNTRTYDPGGLNRQRPRGRRQAERCSS